MQEFIQYVNVLRKRWWLLVAICGVTLATIMIIAQMRPVAYEATVRFLVNVPPSSDVTLYPGFDRPSASQQIAATTASFMEVLRSPTVLQRTRETLGLAMPMSELEQAIFVEKPLDSEFVWVTVTASTAEEAAGIANAVVTEAKDYYGEIQAAPSAAAREFISAQVLEAEAVVARDRQALEDFKARNEVGDLGEEITVARTILWNLVLSQSQANARGATNEVQTYERLITQEQAELTRLTGLSQDYENLQSRITRSQDYYQFLLDKETEAKLKENEILRVSFIQVVTPATAPSQPVSPYDMRVFALGLAVSLVVGVILIFALEYAELQRRNPLTPKLQTSPSQASD
jgi:uncharacterized protein involved in exopolysaccharide biosynthesis